MLRTTLRESPWTAAAAATLAHAPTIANRLTLDDPALLRESTDLRTLRGLVHLLSTPRDALLGEPGASPVFRPLAAAIDWLVWEIGRAHAPTLHALSCILHAIVAMLLARAIAAQGVARQAAVAAACLFAVHPATTEVVASASARPLAIGAGVALYALGSRGPAGSAKRAAWGAAITLIAVLVHEAFVFLPLLLAMAPRVTGEGKAPAPAIGGLAAVAFVASVPAWRTPLLGAPAATIDAAAGLLLRFARDLVFPSDLSPFVTLPSVGAGAAALLLLVAAVGVGWLVRWINGSRHARSLALGAAWTLGAVCALGPAAARAPASDRGAYLVVVGAAFAVAYALEALGRRALLPARWAPYLPLVVAAALVPLTWGRGGAWRDDAALLRAEAADRPGDVEGELATALLASRAGDFAASRGCLSYVAAHPMAMRAYLCAGVASLTAGEPRAALGFVQPYASRYPYEEHARRALFAALFATGQLDEVDAVLKQWEPRFRPSPELAEARSELTRRRGAR